MLHWRRHFHWFLWFSLDHLLQLIEVEEKKKISMSSIIVDQSNVISHETMDMFDLFLCQSIDGWHPKEESPHWEKRWICNRFSSIESREMICRWSESIKSGCSEIFFIQSLTNRMKKISKTMGKCVQYHGHPLPGNALLYGDRWKKSSAINDLMESDGKEKLSHHGDRRVVTDVRWSSKGFHAGRSLSSVASLWKRRVQLISAEDHSMQLDDDPLGSSDVLIDGREGKECLHWSMSCRSMGWNARSTSSLKSLILLLIWKEISFLFRGNPSRKRFPFFVWRRPSPWPMGLFSRSNISLGMDRIRLVWLVKWLAWSMDDRWSTHMSAEDCLPLDIRLWLDLEPLQSLFIFIFSIVEQSMDEEGETGGVAKKRPLRQRRRRVLSPLDR